MSASRMRFGRPPTLWWLLITADGPLTETLSMTSGYSVPCARKPTFGISRDASSKTRMNSRPMIFRFRSGLRTPLSRVRNRSEASTT